MYYEILRKCDGNDWKDIAYTYGAVDVLDGVVNRVFSGQSGGFLQYQICLLFKVALRLVACHKDTNS